MADTYSFLDCILNMTFATGNMTITGKGIGTLTVAMAQDRSVIETASDGNPMVSKIAGNNGSLTITVQQTSDAHKFLLGMYNALIISPPALWAQGVALLRCTSDSTSHSFTGVCFQKLGDKAYDKQGQMVTWVLLCADIQSVPF